MLVSMWVGMGKECYTLLVGMWISVATMEISMEMPQKLKNRPTSNATSGRIPNRIKVSLLQRYLHVMFIVTLFTIAKL
jgi:hypothetical protein